MNGCGFDIVVIALLPFTGAIVAVVLWRRFDDRAHKRKEYDSMKCRITNMKFTMCTLLVPARVSSEYYPLNSYIY